MAHSFKNLKIVRENVIETFFCESICLCKFNSSPAKNERIFKRFFKGNFKEFLIALH